MAAYFTVVQYVPDPIADERINIGVIVYGDSVALCRFVQSWDRAARFAREDITYLREFAFSIQQTVEEQYQMFRLSPQIDLSTLRAMSTSWRNSIQLTAPQPSLLSPDQLLAEIAADFLKEPVPTKREYRDKRSVISQAVQDIERAIDQRFNITTARYLIRRQYPYQGKRDPHKLDVALKNGQLYVGAYAISFELLDIDELERQYKVVAWDVSDLRGHDSSMPLFILAYPPRPDTSTFREAMDVFRHTERTCHDFNVPVVTEGDFSQWATDAVRTIPLSAIPRHLAQALHR